MKRLVATMLVAFFFLLTAWVFDLGYVIAIIIWMITITTIVVGFILAIFWLLTAREKYLTIRATRMQQEQEALVKVVQAGDKVFIRDLNHNAWWRAAHLDPRVYANSQNTYEQASEFEKQRWFEYNRPRVIEQSIKQLSANNGSEPMQTFFNLLDSYPHLMLLGATNSGKTMQAVTAAEYRLSQHSGAVLVWLSTHANLDAHIIPSTAIIFSDIKSISKCLKNLLVSYQKRREGGNYRHVVLAIDEWPEIVDELRDLGISGGDILRRLSRGGRKTGFSLILASHGGTVSDLDTAGHSSVKQDFAQVYLSQKLTQQGKALWQQFDKKSSQVEILLPGFHPDLVVANPDAEFIQLVQNGMSRQEASQQAYHKDYAGTSHVYRLKRLLGE